MFIPHIGKMMPHIFLIVQILAVGVFADHQTYPGTDKRPVLSDSEAARFTKEAYLQGWTPATISTSHADYVVGSGGYSTIQAAVNAAINAGGTTRRYIHIGKGTYSQIVIIPKTTVPITIFGTQGAPGDVVISVSQGANMKGSDYAKQNGANFKEGDPAYSQYQSCASKDTLGTFCTQVLNALNDDFELAYVTVENPSLDGQAVAVSSQGNRQNFDNVHIYGFQDTLYVKGKTAYFLSPTIKGDVDFIFGNAAAVFERAQIIGRGDRPRSSGVVFAPDTERTEEYGFLVINSKITADGAVQSQKGLHLARAWDASSCAGGCNGQVVIRETEIDDVINVDAPYDTAAGGRPYSGNANTNRNLDDTNYNRFWEYKNTGSGA